MTDRSNSSAGRAGRWLDFVAPASEPSSPSGGGSFGVQLSEFAKKVQANADEIVGRVIVSIAAELDERSPVGDATRWKHQATIADNGNLIQQGVPAGYVGGRFRGNWQLGINLIPEGETGRVDPTGSETLSTITATIPEHPAGTMAYLANNVPYARALEEGHSRQAPQGMVALTSMGWQARVDAAAAGLK